MDLDKVKAAFNSLPADAKAKLLRSESTGFSFWYDVFSYLNKLSELEKALYNIKYEPQTNKRKR